MELRDYQKEAIDRVRDRFRQGQKRVGLMLPTGAGKTHVAKQIIENAVSRGNRVLFIVDRIELIDQASESFDDNGIAHGVIQADHWRTNSGYPVQICSIQSLARRKWPDFQLAIVDEFHSVYRTQVSMMNKNPDIHFLGLSATPYTKGLGTIWQSLVVGATTKQLIDQGYLSDFDVYAPPPPDLSKIKVRGGDYVNGELSDIMDQKNPIGDVVRTWKKYGNDNQTIGFAVNIEHSKHLTEAFQKEGILAEHIDAYTDPADRWQIVEAYKQGRIKMLFCVDVLTKGFDAPATGTLIMARPTKSLTVHIQQIGRALRIAPDKDAAIILDHGGNVERHGFPTDETLPTTLDKKEKTEPKEAKKKESLPKSCPKCFFVKDAGVRTCPNCGHTPERTNTVEHDEGELVKITRASVADKQHFYSGLLGYAQQKKYAKGWAKHKYRAKFGVWPRNLSDIPKAPDEIVRKFITSQNIRYAHRKK